METLRSPLGEIVKQFANHRVLVVGDVMLDEYITGACSRLSPEAPVPVVAVASSRAVLGGAANTAHNIAALGGQATLVALAGNDEAASQLRAQAEQAGIEYVGVTDGGSTVRKVRVLGQQQQLLRLDYETNHPLGADAERQVLETVRSSLPRCALVVISDYAKGLLTRSLCENVIAAARASGKQVIIDPRPQHGTFYVGCDVLTPNWKESRGLLGLPEDELTQESVDETGRLLARTFGSNVLMTLGAHGMVFFDRSGDRLFSEASIAREVFDVSGAGDTVVATFGLAIASGCSYRDAVNLANRAAGLVVAKLGTATVSAQELVGADHRGGLMLSRHELAPLASRLRAEGKRIVTVNGSFDVLHPGHLHILHEARQQGDVLIVGLNSDTSVRNNKGSDRPYIGEAGRAAMLMALKDVDFVHIVDEPVPMSFLEEIKPDVHVNGSEYGADCIEAPTVRSHGGRIHVVHRIPGLSTSALVEHIRQRADV